MATRSFRPLTYEERMKLEGLLKRKDLSLRAIATLIGRNHFTIRYELKKGGGDRDRYSAAKSQKETELRRAFNPEKRNFNREGIERRIENLEMQIDILIHKIKAMEGTYDSKYEGIREV